MKEKIKKKAIDTYHNAKKNYISYSLTLIVILIFAIVSFLLDFNLVIIEIFIYFMILMHLIRNDKIVHLKNFLLATLMSITWISIANGMYSYNKDFITLFGINLFPLFAWAIGLFIFYLIYSYLKKYINVRNFYLEFLLVSFLYFIIIIWFETTGYHTFGIHDLATSQYPGLPFCDCIHAPLWMQISYLLMGPIFYVLSQKIIFKKKEHNLL